LSVLYEFPEVLAACEELDLAVVNKQPLAMGLLTGKFDHRTTFPDDDVRREWDLGDGRHAKRLEQVEAIGETLMQDGRTLAQGALGWIWSRSDKTVPIPGFKTVAQVTENAQAMEFGPLSEAQMQQIDEILGRSAAKG
jgi:aryl-alcohol dehydrogenase-like predicted oxidoreductase